jgi:hypothetical protein
LADLRYPGNREKPINHSTNQFAQLNIFVENERSGFNRGYLTNSREAE